MGANQSGSALRVLAFGDSLTAGFPSLEPYAQAMAESLSDMGIPVEVTVCGLCGMTVHQMLAGMNESSLIDSIGRTGIGLMELVRVKRGFWTKADIVLVMAGTSDLTSPSTAG